MAETRFEEEIGVITLQDAVQSRNAKSEIENENEDFEYDAELANLEWRSAVSLRGRYYNYLPEYGDRILDYSSGDYINECFDYMSEDMGDQGEMTVSDIDDFLSETGYSLRDYSSIWDIAQAAADREIEDAFWSYRTEILQYYAICYYQDAFGDMIPTELAEEIDNELNYRSFDRLSEVEDIIDDWVSDHEGFENYMPED